MDTTDPRESQDAPSSNELRFVAICDRFEARWKQGAQPQIESYLKQVAAEDRPVLLRELVARAMKLQAAGENPGWFGGWERFPAVAEGEREGESASSSSQGSGRGGSHLDLTLSYESSVDPALSATSNTSARRTTGTPRTTVVDVDRFADEVIGLGLLSASEIDAILGRDAPELRPRHAEEFARRLVQAGKLTAYQAGALCQGKSKGLVVGNYLVLDRLGAGGMGIVFKAIHRRLKRVVALKVLYPSAALSDRSVRRFRREAVAAAQIAHPRIVTTFDADETQGLHYLVMEYVEGKDLSALVQAEGPLPVDRAVEIILQAAEGLKVAHAMGIVHRDLKPSNLILDASAQAKILDLGLARIRAEADPIAGPHFEAELTQAGSLLGSIDYMSPEQAYDPTLADQRSDIYSLGCILHFLLTGWAPYPVGTLAQRLFAHREREIPSLRVVRFEVPPGLEAIYRRMLAKQPEDRYPSVEALLDALRSCMHATPEWSSRESVDDHAEIFRRVVATPTTLLADDRGSRPVHADGARGRFRFRSTAILAVSTVLISAAIVWGTFRLHDGSVRKEAAPNPKGTDRGPLARSDVPPAPQPEAPPLLAPPFLRDPSLRDDGGATTPPEPVGIEGMTRGAVLPGIEDPAESLKTHMADRPTLEKAVKPVDTEPPLAPIPDADRLIHPGLTDVALAPDGRRALSCGNDGSVLYWDLDSRELIHRFEAGGRVLSVAFSPDGTQALSVVDETTLILWDLSGTFAERGRFEGHTDLVHSVAFSPRGDLVASGGADRTVRLWDVTTRGEVARLDGHGAAVRSVAFSRDGRFLLSAGDDRTAQLWDASSRTEVQDLPGHQGPVLFAAFSPDGQSVLTGCDDGFVRLWNLASGRMRWRRRAHEGPVQAGAWSPGGGVPFTAANSEAGGLILWDERTGNPLDRIETPPGIRVLAPSADGQHALSGDRNGRLESWTLRATVARPGPAPAEIGAGVVVSEKSFSLVHAADFRAFQDWIAHVRARRLIPLGVDLHDSGGVPLVTANAIPNPDGRAWSIRIDRGPSAFERSRIELRNQGFQLAGCYTFPGFGEGEDAFITVWRQTGLSDFELFLGIDRSQLALNLADQTARGKRLLDLSAYLANRSVRFNAVFIPNTDRLDSSAEYDLGPDQFARRLREVSSNGQLPLCISPYPVDKSYQVALVAVPNVEGLAWEYDRSRLHTSSELMDQVRRRARKGYRPLLVSGVWQRALGDSLYHALWVR